MRIINAESKRNRIAPKDLKSPGIVGKPGSVFALNNPPSNIAKYSKNNATANPHVSPNSIGVAAANLFLSLVTVIIKNSIPA